MQSKLVKSWDASNSQALPVFGVGVAFIDESVFSLKQSHEIEKAIENVRLIVSSISSVYKGIHIKPIENICSSDSKDGRSRLSELLDMITDTTGKEDFLQYLRMLSLQKVLYLSLILFIDRKGCRSSFLTLYCLRCSPDCS